MSVEINGLEVLLGRLDLFTDMDRLEAGLNRATLFIEDQAKMKCPDYEIRQSIQSKVKDFEGTVFTPHRRAPYVEYGTGIFADPESGHPHRTDVPWVYVEGTYNEKTSSRRYTEAEADWTVASMRAQGIPAVKTYGSKPFPYMRPALDENTEYIKQVLGEALIND